jgi:hypothetical protein
MKHVSKIIAVAALSTVAISANAQNIFGGFTTEAHLGLSNLQLSPDNFFLNYGGPVVSGGASASTPFGKSTLDFAADLSQQLTADANDARFTSTNYFTSHVGITSPLKMGHINKLRVAYYDGSDAHGSKTIMQRYFRVGLGATLGAIDADLAMDSGVVTGDTRHTGYDLDLGTDVAGGTADLSYNYSVSNTTSTDNIAAYGISYATAAAGGELKLSVMNNKRSGTGAFNDTYVGFGYTISTAPKPVVAPEKDEKPVEAA